MTTAQVTDATPAAFFSNSTDRSLQDAIARSERISLGVAAGAVLVILAISWVISRSVTRPLHRVRLALQALATGDLTASAEVGFTPSATTSTPRASPSQPTVTGDLPSDSASSMAFASSLGSSSSRRRPTTTV